MIFVTVLVIGASGLVGYEFYRQNKHNEDWYFTYNTHKMDDFIQLDATIAENVKEIMKKLCPDIVIVSAAMPNVNACETERENAYRINVGIIENILKFAPKKSKIVFFSTDYIFDGQNGPYNEHDKQNPLNYYGKIKLICESMIISSGLDYLIIRTTGIFGWEKQRKNFVFRVIDTLNSGKNLDIPNDQFGNPTYVKDLIHAVMILIDKNCKGIYNVVGREWIQREEFARIIAKSFNLNDKLITGKPTSFFKDIAARPLKAGFKTDKIEKLGIRIRSISDAFADMKRGRAEDDVYN